MPVSNRLARGLENALLFDLADSNFRDRFELVQVKLNCVSDGLFGRHLLIQELTI